jgi:magnesium transporter
MLRGQVPRFSSSPIEESPFGMLSESEERELRRHEGEDSDGEGRGTYLHEERRLSDAGSTRTYQSGEGDRRDRRERRGTHHLEASLGGLGGMGLDEFEGGVRSVFDFTAMDEFAASEREPRATRRVAVETARRHSPVRGDVTEEGSGGSSTRKSGSMQDSDGSVQKPSPALVASAPPEPEEEAPVQTNFQRRRARKLSQSNPVRRQPKLALFESFGGGGGDDPLATGALKAPRQGKQFVDPPPAFTAYTDAAPGHDRPYRFSFYSNALPVTIHARTLAELPAEGQTFEDLFKGRSNPADATGAGVGAGGGLGTDYGATPTRSGRNTPNEPSLLSQQAAKIKGLQKSLTATATSTLPPSAEEDPDAFTWWLDVLSPTDEEMRMLSKVFGIHPLTTEDILLEETREKIELFRHYYLVCFRSFDQDPYSQTYLEPLNMYIIVFREGTLSFHFRGTPHPQNVRRRIKHLKDYISVTSDWISYALIDDITDAFGPLIQSIEYEVDSIDELVLILKEAEQTDMLRRIGTCRKKVMGLLRLMGSKADVVKGLAKRCNENWLVAPKSDIGLYLSDIQDHLITMTSVSISQCHSWLTPSPEPEPLREDSLAFSLKLPGANLNRNDRRQQPDQRRALKAHCPRYRPHSHELGHRPVGYERQCARPECRECE